MQVVACVFAVLALAGWALAYRLHIAKVDHVCPTESPSKAVLLNFAGLPESIRALRQAPPKTYSRPQGNKPAIIYERIGTAVVYQATSAKQ
jgi:hypothetical protein